MVSSNVAFVSLLLLSTRLSTAQLEEREFFVSASDGVDSQDCGSQLTPCASLPHVLNLTSVLEGTSRLLVDCYTPSLNSADEQGVAIYLLEGEFSIDPFCIRGWENFTLSGLGQLTTIRSSVLGNTLGIFAILDSSDVNILNLTFVDSVVGRSVIYVDNSTGVAIRDCSVPLYADGSFGLWLVDPYGTNTIANVRFYSIPALVKFQALTPATALFVKHGQDLDSLGLQGEEMAKNSTPFDIVVSGCTFEKIVVEARYTTFSRPDDYKASSTRSNVLLIHFQSKAVDSRVKLIDCIFQDNIVSFGSIALVTFSGRSTSNSVEFRDCLFQNNLARFGGGVAAYFTDTAEQNSVSVINCIFASNEAILEGGGIFVASLVQNPQNSFFDITDGLFYSNSALYGAGVFLFNDPTLYRPYSILDSTSLPLMPISINNSQFRDNNAQLTEGVVNTLRIQGVMRGINIITGNNGSGIVLRSSTMKIQDEIVFSHNKAFSGGGLKILDTSLIDMQFLVMGNFTFNEASFTGGAIYADESSTTITADQYNHTVAQAAIGNCFVKFPSTLFDKALLYFSNNTAVSSGNDFAIFCIRSCFQSYFVPDLFKPYTLDIFGNPVVIETDNPLGSASTGPTYLFFYGASTKCYKPVGNITYLLPNCSHQLLMDNFNSLPELSCAITNTVQTIQQLITPGRGAFHPLVDQLIIPWASIGNTWASINSPDCFEPSPASLMLSPAPGEEFDLTIQLADQLLNFITGTVFVEVDHKPEVSPGVLLQLNGIQYAYNDRIYFTPNRALSGLTLVGLPGTEGHISIVSVSQILGLPIVLQVPFKLSQCPLGYYNPPVMSSNEQVDELILGKYSTTQRIPLGSPLSCQCYTDSGVQFSAMEEKYRSDCIGGYTVNLNSILWAGLIPLRNSTGLDELPTSPCLDSFGGNSAVLTDPLSVLIKGARAKQLELLGAAQDPDANPIDVVPYQGVILAGGGAPVKCYSNYTITELVDFRVNGEFSVDLCTRGFCRGNSETEWYLSDVGHPCVENRQGVLCGQCKPHLSLTLTTTKCQDCSRPRWYIPLLITVVLGLLLVICVVAFNVGVSPTVDSFLFFIQAVYVIVSSRLDYRDFERLSLFNLDFTFDQCITSDLKALPRLLFQYVTPLYILSLLLVVLLLTKIKGFSKYFGKHSFLHALWLIVLVSFLNIANSTFEILNCQKIGPHNIGFRELVLAYDASVMCWSGLHLPFGILAVVLATVLIIPFPLYAGMAIRVPKLKPITDVYTSIYCDSQRYWIVWNIFRRILVVMIGVFVTDFVVRHFSLLLASVLILVVSIFTWPYKYWIDNVFGIFILILLVLFCVVTQPEVYVFADPHRAVSWTIVAVVIFSTLVLLVVEVALCLSSRRGLGYSKQSLKPSKAIAKLWQLTGLAVDKLKLKKKSHRLLELEESVSNQYYERESDRYKEYREPLIDSVRYSSSGREQKNNSKPVVVQEIEGQMRINEGSNVVSNSVVTHSTIIPQ